MCIDSSPPLKGDQNHDSQFLSAIPNQIPRVSLNFPRSSALGLRILE